jgi:hypothetical protein
MGTDAEVFLFDHAAYSTTVVPAFSGLLRGEQAADWLEPFIKRRELKLESWDKSDLDRLRAALNPDLSWAGGPYDLEWTYDSDRGFPGSDTVEQLNWLFEKAVSLQCLGDSQFVGRSMTVSQYSDLLSELGVSADDRIFALLSLLGKRGYLIGYKFGFGFEGINGWLDASETAELAEQLDGLPLPRYEMSFAAMEQFRAPGKGPYECHGFSFEALSLSFVRTTAFIAAQQKLGLLWGNGLVSDKQV